MRRESLAKTPAHLQFVFVFPGMRLLPIFVLLFYLCNGFWIDLLFLNPLIYMCSPTW